MPRRYELIFVGSPSENLSRSISRDAGIRLSTSKFGERKGDLSIVSRHPKPGEAVHVSGELFIGTPLTEDYAVVGLVPSVSPQRLVTILAVRRPSARRARSSLLCRPDAVEKLMQEMPGSATEMKNL